VKSVSTEQVRNAARRTYVTKSLASVLMLSAFGLAVTPAAAQTAPAVSGPDAPATPATDSTNPAIPPASAQIAAGPAQDISSTTQSQTDILSRNTLYALVDARLVVADGARSFVNGGLGKTRFQGKSDGGYKARIVPAEGDIVWVPRFTGSLSANVSVGWQRDHGFDLIEAFVNFLPQQTSKVSFSARAGLMWPEISLEHSTGGAWSVVNTITPSAINSWVGEEVKVVGLEGTLHASLGQHELSATGAVFGFNDTSGTLLSFRGWALQDIKATGFAHFELPPRDQFLTGAQQDVTRSTIEIDNRVGFYGRLDWRPPWPFGVAVFYYDNRGDPKAFTKTLQWGWRTRFWNVGINADLGPNTKLLAQGMTGSTIMGFPVNGVAWVHTKFDSAYVLIAQTIDTVTVSGRVEAFGTHEHGSEMDPNNSENGWALTVAARTNITNNLTAFAEALNVRSHRGARVQLVGLEPFEAQTVFQIALRYRI
jgi:hypothetical protein